VSAKHVQRKVRVLLTCTGCIACKAAFTLWQRATFSFIASNLKTIRFDFDACIAEKLFKKKKKERNKRSKYEKRDNKIQLKHDLRMRMGNR